MRKILLTGACSCTSKEIDKLCALGCKIDFIQQEADVITTPEAYDAVICNNLFAYHDIRMFSNLEYIQLTSAGSDRVPMHSIKEKGIIIKNARGVYSIPIAEHVVMFALELMRNGKFFVMLLLPMVYPISLDQFLLRLNITQEILDLSP